MLFQHVRTINILKTKHFELKLLSSGGNIDNAIYLIERKHKLFLEILQTIQKMCSINNLAFKLNLEINFCSLRNFPWQKLWIKS